MRLAIVQTHITTSRTPWREPREVVLRKMTGGSKVKRIRSQRILVVEREAELGKMGVILG